MSAAPLYTDAVLVDYAAWCACVPRKPDEDDRAYRRRWQGARNDRNYKARKAGVPEPFPERVPDAQRRAIAAMTRQADRNLGMLDVKEPATDEQWETYFSLLEQADDAHSDLSPLQEQTTFVAPDDHLPIAVAFTGDWHVGGSGVLYKQLRQDMETIRDTDGLYGVIMGDLTNNFQPMTKAGHGLLSDLFSEPGSQDRYALMRAKIAAGRWLAVCEGNHDAWSTRGAGIARTADFAARLGAPYFSQGGGTIHVHIGAQRYVLAVRHNSEGNSKLNTENPMRRAFDSWPTWEGLDLICLAHLHYNDAHTVTRKGGRCVYLRNGTYKVRDGYSQEHGYKSEYGVPLAILLPDERRIIPWRGDDFAHGVAYFRWLRAEYRQRGE